MSDDDDSVDERELARRRREVAGWQAEQFSDWPPEIISAIARELILRLPDFETQKRALNLAATAAIRLKRMREGK